MKRIIKEKALTAGINSFTQKYGSETKVDKYSQEYLDGYFSVLFDTQKLWLQYDWIYRIHGLSGLCDAVYKKPKYN